MPLLNKLISTRNNIHNQDSKYPFKIEIGTINKKRNSLHFDVNQVRVLLFKECEWRGRKLLFDSVTVKRNNIINNNNSNFINNNVNKENGQKNTDQNDSCPRNGNGLPQENEKDPCDNVSLLSEMIFGSVAMTYRGPLFKIHSFDSPKCIMCTKVFPASDHNSQKQSGRHSDETLGTCVNIDFNSSNGSTRNTLSSPSSGVFSGASLRKSSTSSSTCSGWDIDLPPLGSSQSLESNSSSSGFSSISSLRRRWIRAVSTALIHTESDDIFGIQPCGDTSGDICDFNARKHKTRLGLAVLIKLTPGQEQQMESRLLEHAAQLEAMLNRLCYACIESNQRKTDVEHKGLILRLHQASFRCSLWLLRLLVNTNNNNITPSIWHEVLLNSSALTDLRVNLLCNSFNHMCQLLNIIDTKSTNFFLSTIVTAILTYHLGWVNTIIPPHDKAWVENVKKKFFCNPLWAQLGDLYGTLGNPAKLVHTVVTGNPEKATIINGILIFLSYFIRSAIIEKRHEIRHLPEEDIKKAISIVQQKRRKNIPNSSRSNYRMNIKQESSNSRLESRSKKLSKELIEQIDPSVDSINSNYNDFKGQVNLNIPRLRKITSKNKNLNLEGFNYFKDDDDKSIKLNECQDDLPSDSLYFNSTEKIINSNPVKIIVSQATPEQLESEKYLPGIDDSDRKDEQSESDSITTKLLYLNQFQSDRESKTYTVDDTEVYYSQIELNDDKNDQVLFTLGGEEKSLTSTIPTINPGPSPSLPPSSSSILQDNFYCQCSFAFTRVPSTSAQLPEGVLRKILQRNFPESSKSMQRQSETSFGKERPFGFCPKCNGSANSNYDGSKLLLETPTNATEVSRTCGNSLNTRGARPRRSDSLEELLEANNVIELPMPRSKNIVSVSKEFKEVLGFTDTLLQRNVTKSFDCNHQDSGYTSGLVIQGIIKKEEKNEQRNSQEETFKKNLIAELREEISINARFPMVDSPVSEAVCILADVDNWQVGIISNTSSQSPLLPIGMSKLVSNMLEAFLFLWTKYQSPTDCLNILESKLKEMWLRSEALAEMLMSVDVCDISLASLTNALDLEAADIPLLLAVATTHSPQIAQRIGLTLT